MKTYLPTLSLLLALPTACGGPPPEAVDVDTSTQPITSEQPNGVAQRVWNQYLDGDVALRSYALMDTGGCSGTMIGPNVMMSAAHCSGAPKTIRFRLYRTLTTVDTEAFNCRYLTHGYPETDLILFYCDPNAAGENPGDKYGYVDFDIDITSTGSLDYLASKNRVSVGANIYKVWQNPITNLGINDAMLYSSGSISSITDSSWYTPDNFGSTNYRCGSSSNQSNGVSSQIWSNGGSSGSSALSATRHRALLGPQSTGVSDGLGSNQLSMVQYLYSGFANQNVGTPSCSSGTRDTVNQPEVTALGLTPANYYGWIDNDLDGMFDVQRDLEALQGEAQRDWLWLGFESHRRNRMWTKDRPSGVAFDTADPKTGIARLTTVGNFGSSYDRIMSNASIDLVPWEYHEVSIMTYLSQSSRTYPMRICLRGSYQRCRTLNPTIGAWQMHVFPLYASPGAELTIEMVPGTKVSLAALSVVRRGAAMDFDSHDVRYNWRDENNGGRARIWPVGRQSTTGATDWAGVVTRDPSQPYWDDWSLRNRQLAVDGGYNYRVCFWHKASVRDPISGTLFGVVRTSGSGAEVSGSRRYFLPGNSWAQTCTNSFSVSGDDNNVMFGTYRIADANGSYLVDDITVERL